MADIFRWHGCLDINIRIESCQVHLAKSISDPDVAVILARISQLVLIIVRAKRSTYIVGRPQ